MNNEKGLNTKLFYIVKAKKKQLFILDRPIHMENKYTKCIKKWKSIFFWLFLFWSKHY